jgi:hypothetical protein
MRGTAILVGVCCLALSGFALVRAQNAGHDSAKSSLPASKIVPPVPPYHSELPKGPLPPTLDPKIFPDPLNQKVYGLAAKEKGILYQQPCYCGCDREAAHHQSLLDCYRDRHASICAACKMEAVFAYQEYRKGKSAVQIRQEIIAGKWRSVDLSPYSGTARAR